MKHDKPDALGNPPEALDLLDQFAEANTRRHEHLDYYFTAAQVAVPRAPRRERRGGGGSAARPLPGGMKPACPPELSGAPPSILGYLERAVRAALGEVKP